MERSSEEKNNECINEGGKQIRREGTECRNEREMRRGKRSEENNEIKNSRKEKLRKDMEEGR